MVPEEITTWQKFIDKSGFPIVAYVMVFLFMAVIVQNNTKAVQSQTEVMIRLVSQLTSFQSNVEDDHYGFRNDMSILKERTRP